MLRVTLVGRIVGDTPSEVALMTDLVNRTIVKVDQAGHWLHHDQLEIFLRETRKFLAE